MCGEYMYRIAIARLWERCLFICFGSNHNHCFRFRQALSYTVSWGRWAPTVTIGIYIMLFAGSIYLLKQRPNKLFLVGPIILFILTIAITILFFLEVLLEPVATRMSTFIDGTTVPCSQLQVNSHETVVGSLLVVLVCACRAVMFVISDAALIFHCVVLWGAKKWIVAFPFFLLFASTVCNLAQVYYGARIYTLAYQPTGTSTSTVGMAVAATRFSDAATSLLLATNILTSILVALKIWLMTKEIENVLGRKADLRYRAIISMLRAFLHVASSGTGYGFLTTTHRHMRDDHWLYDGDQPDSCHRACQDGGRL